MRKKSWWLGLAALMALAGFMVGACTVDSGGSGGPDSEVPAVSAVTVTPASVVLAPKDTQQFTAKVEVTGDLATTVTWTVEGEGKNAGTTISDAGLLTVAEGEIVTPLTVRATSTADPAKSGTAKVTVSFYSVSKVTVDPKTAKVIRGDTQQFTAKVEVTGDLATTVTWTVEGAGKAGTTISDAGLLTVATDETAPSLTVKAASTVDSAKFDTATVTVDAGSVSKVTVSPKAPTLGAGGTQQFTAKVDVTGGLAQTVTWSVEGEGKQVGTTITDAGLLTLDKDETVTPLTVRATSTADPAKFDTATVTVNAALVSKVTVDPESIALAPGDTQQFTANLAVTWTVEGAGKAGTTITDAGLLTLDKDETVTPLTVRATSTADPAKSGTAEVTVSTGSVSKVTVDPKTPTVTRGTTLQFTGTVEATGGLPTTVTWSVVEEDIKAGTTISEAGLLTVDKDETAGTSFTVKVTSTVDTTKFDTATVTVSAGPEYAVTISLDFAGNIILSGASETNTISKSEAGGLHPGITLSAEGYDSSVWYVDGVAVQGNTTATITLEAKNYDVRRHSVSFMGVKNGILYAKEIPFTVVE